jgi:glycerophosphoryl diester phosphodiesterase
MEFPRYIAHRGLHDKFGRVPENSLAAFELAAEKGFAAELDVRFTADKKMVVFHDENTARMCGVDLDIEETDYSDLCGLRLMDTDERIPLLSEVLKLVAGRVMLFIELKSAPHVPDAEKRLAHLMKKYRGEFAVQSFDPLSLSRLRFAAPGIVRGQLVSTYSGKKRVLREIAATKPVWKTLSRPQYLAWDLRSVTLEAAFYAADIDAHFITWTAAGRELIEAAEDFSGSIIFEDVPEDYFDGKLR